MLLQESHGKGLIGSFLQGCHDLSSCSWRIPIAAVCMVLIAVPFLATTFPPIVDLPQHTAQIRLFWETLSNPDGSSYRIQWLAPYNLSYLLIGTAVELFGYANGGRLAMMVVAILWCLSIHYLAYRRNRSVESAVLASLFSLNLLVYWGFYSFLLGMPLFIIWFLMCTESYSYRLGLMDLPLWLAMAFLLYFAHILWYVAAGVTVLVAGVCLRVPRQRISYRVACLLPAFAMFVYWWLRSDDFNPYAAPPIWRSLPAERVSLAMVMQCALGGLRGSTPHVMILGIVAWIAVAVRQNWRNNWAKIDKSLFAAACVFWLVALSLPDRLDISVMMWQRWMPVAAVFFLLAMPTPLISVFWRRLVTLAFVAFFSLSTTFAWQEFQERDLSGLREALDALPANSKVIGLAYCKESKIVDGRPFLQIFAYAQVLKQCRLNFSISDLKRGLVVTKHGVKKPWTRNIEWYAEKATPRDVKYFDYVIACRDTALGHMQILEVMPVAPVTRTGRWRLYRVKR